MPDTTFKGSPACTRTNDTKCRLSATGLGAVSISHTGGAATGSQDYKVSVKIKGAVNCEGKELYLFLNLERMNQTCDNNQSCLAQAADRVIRTTCKISNGGCSGKGSIVASDDGTGFFQKNEKASYSVTSCGVISQEAEHLFNCGFVLE